MKEIKEKKKGVQGHRKSNFWSLVLLFLKAQLSALIGVIFDYALMMLLTEVFGVFYVISIVCGAVFGSVINYIINRYWAFNARKESKLTQLPKFAIVVLSSIILKTGGTYLATEYLHIDYRISRIMTDAIVAYGFIFVLQKTWVFKEENVY